MNSNPEKVQNTPGTSTICIFNILTLKNTNQSYPYSKSFLLHYIQKKRFRSQEAPGRILITGKKKNKFLPGTNSE